MNFVNDNFKISWFNFRTEKDETKIDPTVVQECCNGKSEFNSTATVYLTDRIEIKAHFFDNSEFENDIDPGEFLNMQDHQQLMNYMKQVSNHEKRSCPNP